MLLAVGSLSVSVCLFWMQWSGLASAVTPHWHRALPAPGAAGARSGRSCSWENISAGGPTHLLAMFWDAADPRLSRTCRSGWDSDPARVGAGRSCSPPHLDADRVSLSSGGCPCGSRDNHGGHSSGQSLVLLVAVNLSWLEMHRGRFYFSLWTSLFPNSPQNQLGCSHFSCQVPRVFPCISLAECLPACSSAGAWGERTGSSNAAGTRGTAQPWGNPRAVVAPQEKDVAEFPCRRQTCPRALACSPGSIAAAVLPHTCQRLCQDSWGAAAHARASRDGARSGSEPRAPELLAAGDGAGAQLNPEVPGSPSLPWQDGLGHCTTRDVERAAGRERAPQPMYAEEQQGQRKPWPGGGLGTAGTGPKPQPRQGTAVAQERAIPHLPAHPI